MDKAKNIPLKKFLTGNLGTVLGLTVLVVVFTALNNIFLTPSNIRSILIQSDTNAIIAVGMTYVIISGNINIPVDTSLVLSPCVGVILMVGTGNVGLGMAVALLTGILLGLLSGSLVAYLGFPPLIMTLSTTQLFRGIVYLYTEGQVMVGLPQRMTSFTIGGVLYIPNIIQLIAIICIMGHIALQKTTVKRRVCAVGGNSELARLSDINVKRVILVAFVLPKFCVALSGIACMGRLNSGQPIADQSCEMYAITAAVIGGASLTKGGIGSMVGTLIETISIFALQNGLTILNVNTYWQQVYMGVTLLLAVGLDQFRKSIRQRRRKKRTNLGSFRMT